MAGSTVDERRGRCGLDVVAERGDEQAGEGETQLLMVNGQRQRRHVVDWCRLTHTHSRRLELPAHRRVVHFTNVLSQHTQHYVLM